MSDAIALTRSLRELGLDVERQEVEDGRPNVVGVLKGSGGSPSLMLNGHLDTSYSGTEPWLDGIPGFQPKGFVRDGRIFGRGVCDMKAGLAAMLLAARSVAKKLSGTPGVVLVLTAAEEGGCIGSQHLARTQLLGKAGAIVVGEPTSNYPYVGHKGSLKFYARFRGVSAHASMPDLGVNAIYKAARAVARLEAFDFGQPAHPVMGMPTMNVGTFAGGEGVNMVPDSASVGVDIRTVPGMDHMALRTKLQALLGDEAEIDVFSDMNAVWTEPEQDWVRRVFEIAGRTLGVKPEPRAQTYNTDAGNLLRVYKSAPTVVLGPGEPQQAHQTDEWCSMERVRQSVGIYEALIRDWCGN